MARKRKKRRSDAGTWALLSGTVGGLLRNMLSDGLENGFADLYHRTIGQRNKKRDDSDDVAGRVLRVLAERGPMNIPDLLSAAEVGLTPLLEALGTSHQFKLVEFVGEGDLIKLTATGTRIASVVQQQRIKSDARKQLEH